MSGTLPKSSGARKTPQDVLAMARKSLESSEAVDGDLSIVSETRFIIETEDAEYRVTVDPDLNPKRTGWIYCNAWVKDDHDTEHISSGQTTKSGWVDIWEAITFREKIFRDQREFLSGWASLDDAAAAWMASGME